MGAHCRSQQHGGQRQSVNSCAGGLYEWSGEVQTVEFDSSSDRAAVARLEARQACSASRGCTYVPARVNLARSHPILRRRRRAATRTGPAVELSVKCYCESPIRHAELHPKIDLTTTRRGIQRTPVTKKRQHS